MVQRYQFFLSRLTTMYWLNSMWQISDIVHDTRFCQYYSLNKFRFQVFIHTVQPMPDTCFIRYICQNRVSSAKISKLGNLLQVWLTHPRAGCHGRQLRSRQVTDILLLEFSFLVHHICPFLYTTGSRQLQRCKHLINPPSTLNHCVKRPNVSLPFVLCSLIHRTAQHQPWIYVYSIQTYYQTF